MTDDLGLTHDLRRPIANYTVYESSIAVDAGEVEVLISAIPRLWLVELGSGHASGLLGLAPGVCGGTRKVSAAGATVSGGPYRVSDFRAGPRSGVPRLSRRCNGVHGAGGEQDDPRGRRGRQAGRVGVWNASGSALPLPTQSPAARRGHRVGLAVARQDHLVNGRDRPHPDHSLRGRDFEIVSYLVANRLWNSFAVECELPEASWHWFASTPDEIEAD